MTEANLAEGPEAATPVDAGAHQQLLIEVGKTTKAASQKAHDVLSVSFTEVFIQLPKELHERLCVEHCLG